MDHIRIGTDCSGIEAPIQALDQLGIPYHHVFSSDIDMYVIKSIKANYEPDVIFGDITERDIKDVQDIDLYVCGFPCQAFSHAGYRKGFDDKRGIIFFSCLKVIENKEPKIFILENVKGLLSHDSGNTFKCIISSLEKLDNYEVYWKVMNTRHYGIPQNRERVFIVGIRVDVHEEPFIFPPHQPMDKLVNYIDNTDSYRHPIPECVTKSGLMDRVPHDSIFIEFGFKKHNHPNANIYTPCINANNRMWCVPKHRYSNCRELLSLQGFPLDFKQVVSKTQLKKQIGNSMSVNVVKSILKQLFTSCPSLYTEV